MAAGRAGRATGTTGGAAAGADVGGVGCAPSSETGGAAGGGDTVVARASGSVSRSTTRRNGAYNGNALWRGVPVNSSTTRVTPGVGRPTRTLLMSALLISLAWAVNAAAADALAKSKNTRSGLATRSL